MVFILVGVLPKFTRFFEGKEEILPWTTQLLILMSNSIRGYWWIYGLFAFALFAWFRWWTNSARGKASIDWVLVRGPALSGVYNKISTSNVLRTLGHLMESQVPLLEALDVTRTTTKSPYYSKLVMGIATRVEKGGKFAEAFRDYPYISETVKAMVATGENASKLPPVMLRLAEVFDSEVDREIKTLSSMIEPMALLIMGGVVGLLVSSIILPMFKMAQALH
jgi:type II secretory pathway component PulF